MNRHKNQYKSIDNREIDPKTYDHIINKVFQKKEKRKKANIDIILFTSFYECLFLCGKHKGIRVLPFKIFMAMYDQYFWSSLLTFFFKIWFLCYVMPILLYFIVVTINCFFCDFIVLIFKKHLKHVCHCTLFQTDTTQNYKSISCIN